MQSKIKPMGEGGVTTPRGFLAGAVNAGIRSSKPDLALLLSERDAIVAGMFTTNRVQAAPVKLCRARVAGGTVRAIVVNSGNANACTGPQGALDAERMAELTAAKLGLSASQVLVCSTGTIGIPMPMAKVEAGIPRVVQALNPAGGEQAARAIMTTDTVDKQVAVEFEIDGRAVRLGGMAKGSGMIHPNMATMLGFLTTDAAVEREALQASLREAVGKSFNCISVDNDQSTNDTVLILANGAAGNAALTPSHPQWAVWVEALEFVTRELALKIVRDGEGVTKVVTVNVSGARSRDDARKAARSVANSMLCKTAWFGGDPNWGRIIAAVGYSGAEVREELVDISFDGAAVVKSGRIAPDASLKELAAIYAKKEFSVSIDLHVGQGAETVFTGDLSYNYVKINADYMT